jgi:hypothetical protein
MLTSPLPNPLYTLSRIEFANIWENPYDQTTYPFNCTIDRIGQGVTDSSDLMYISNQFLDTSALGGAVLYPNTDALGTTNSVAGTLSTSNTCASQHGSYPNFILTDYSTIPDYDLVRAVAQVSCSKTYISYCRTSMRLILSSLQNPSIDEWSQLHSTYFYIWLLIQLFI